MTRNGADTVEPCPPEEQLSAFVDGEGEATNADIARHLTRCGACQETVAAYARVNDLVLMRERARATDRADPLRLIAALDRTETALAAGASTTGADAPGPRGLASLLTRRRALGLGTAAAAAATAVAFPLLRPARAALAPTLFDDFSTRIAADKALDVYSSDLPELLAWFDARVPFVTPRLTLGDDVAPRGGRLCWLLERRFAALHFALGETDACLYLADATGLEVGAGALLPAPGAAPTTREASGVAGAFWMQSGLAFSLLGPRSLAEIEDLAERIAEAA